MGRADSPDDEAAMADGLRESALLQRQRTFKFSAKPPPPETLVSFEANVTKRQISMANGYREAVNGIIHILLGRTE